jgi:hypothetical protein
MMLNAYREGKRDLIGFSIDAYVNSNKRSMEGKDVNYVESFEKVNSVDVVCEPAAGGEVIRVVASMDVDEGSKSMKMDKMPDKMPDGEMPEDEGKREKKKMTKE